MLLQAYYEEKTMEIVWLLGLIVGISGIMFLITRLFETSPPKKQKRQRTRIRGSGLVVINDGGAHISVSNSCDHPGDVDCD